MSEPGEPNVAASDATVVGVVDDRWVTLEALHREHYGRLVRLAMLLVDREDTAEELVQDAFVRLHRALDRVEVDAQPAYLRSIVMNLARSRLRRRLVARRHVEPVPVPSAGADADIHVPAERDAVIAALRTLPARQRQCLVLRFYDDCTDAQIADALGISVGSVKSHVHRAMKAMAAQLAAMEGER